MTKSIWLLSLMLVSLTLAEDTIKMAPPMLQSNDIPIEKESRLLSETKVESLDKLPPIPPIFPSFIQPGFIEQLNDQPKRQGILTILVIKSRKPQDGTESNDEPRFLEENFSKLNEFKSQMSDSFSKLASMIMTDLFNNNNNEQQQLIGGGSEDVDRKRVHLLGGKDDIDSKFNNLEQDEPIEEDETDLNSSKFQSMLSWFNHATEPESEPHSMVIRTQDGHSSIIQLGQNEQKKKCMMHSFMRLKASIYYRTIIHLLFISGVMLLIFLMAILSIRVYKRRQALKYYSKNMKIATIEDQKRPFDEQSSRKTFIFRLGSLKNSYAQKSVDSAVLTAPPAYTSLPSQIEDDKKSLPDYEETSSKDQI